LCGHWVLEITKNPQVNGSARKNPTKRKVLPTKKKRNRVWEKVESRVLSYGGGAKRVLNL